MRKRGFLILSMALVLELYVIIGFTNAGRVESELLKDIVWYSYLAAMTTLMIYGGLKLDFRSLVVTSISLGAGMEVVFQLIDMTMVPGLIGNEPLPPFEKIPSFLVGFVFFTVSGFTGMFVVFLLKRLVMLTWKRLSMPRLQT